MIKALVYGVLIYCALCSGTRPPKQYVINLDLPAEQRWTQVALEHKDVIKDFHIMIRQIIPENLIPMVEKIAANLNQYIAAPYAGEMRGIAKALNASVGAIVLSNLIYDANAFCTSIVAQDSQGQIWHSRNLDYPFSDLLKNITIAVNFQRGEKTVYSAVTWAGYIGVLTGQKPYGFTITVNERNKGPNIVNILVGLLVKSVVPVSFLVRDALSDSHNFTTALSLLSNTPTVAPVYFIMGGVNPGEGVVITKGRLEADDIWLIDPAHGRWFEVETNYDHWLPPPPYDDRRGPANKMMKQLGQGNITVQSLYNVMSTKPVLNQWTTYTVVMSAAQPEQMQTWIRV